jgi:hypothetical protein
MSDMNATSSCYKSQQESPVKPSELQFQVTNIILNIAVL